MLQSAIHTHRQTDTGVKSILIVEDDPDIGPFLVESIKLETPYQAMLVTDARKALHTVSNVKPSLLIMDYHIPFMNGIELYDHLCEIDAFNDVPVIMMSALLPYQEVARRHITGIEKPLDLNDFLATIDRLIA